MKIRMRTSIAGPFGAAGAGDIVNIPDDKAEALVAGGFAERIGGVPEAAQAISEPEAEPEAEAAVIEAPEAAVAAPQRKRRGGRG